VSVARTTNVCEPSPSPERDLGLTHAANAPPSSWHSNVEPASVDENENDAAPDPTNAAGPCEIVVSGGVTSTTGGAVVVVVGVGIGEVPVVVVVGPDGPVWPPGVPPLPDPDTFTEPIVLQLFFSLLSLTAFDESAHAVILNNPERPDGSRTLTDTAAFLPACKAAT
jgi:hypothetical protein